MTTNRDARSLSPLVPADDMSLQLAPPETVGEGLSVRGLCADSRETLGAVCCAKKAAVSRASPAFVVY